MENYLKYYWLKDQYLEKDVHDFFHKNHYLTARHFFYIITWKSSYNKPSIRKHLVEGRKEDGKSLDDVIHDLTHRIYYAISKEARLEILLPEKNEINGIQLAMASAVLTILYPEVFTVYDIRVRRQLKNPKTGNGPYPDISYANNNKINRYFEEYVFQVQQFADKRNLSLRNADRVLWAMDRDEYLEKFLDGEDNSVGQSEDGS